MKYFNIKFLFISLFIIHGLKISANVFEGYTLFTNGDSQGATTYLINNNHEIINSWEHPSGVMSTTYLFPDSTLLVPLQVENPFMTSLGPEGGWFQKLDWYGNVKWEYYHYHQNFQPHHDIEPLPNGNFLVIGWERKTEEETLNIGRIQTSGEFWPLKIVEIDPIGQDSGQVVWEWRIWDHLIQDADSTLPNFGPISDHPDLINVNLGNMPQDHHDWLHTNSIDYNEMYDQIVFSSRRLDEFFVIDHSTTTDQAAGDSGGISGKGGNILYRWGNPQNYGRGTENDRMLNAQHGVNWVPINYPGGNNILIFNNNPSGTSDGNSIVIELVPPMEENGQYFISPGSAFGPSVFGNVIWEQMCVIKHAFDPNNQMNPGKVAPGVVGGYLHSITTKTRGECDESIAPLPILSNSKLCDGNSECDDDEYCYQAVLPEIVVLHKPPLSVGYCLACCG